MKLDLSKKAIDELKSLDMEASDKIRIIISGQSCAGPQFGFTLGEEETTDKVVQIDGITFLVEDSILQMCEGFFVDFVDDERGRGFLIKALGMESACSSCSCH